jgi:hypothetical protein
MTLLVGLPELWTNQEFSFVIIPPWFSCSYITFEMKNRFIGGRKSETYSHLIDLIFIIINDDTNQDVQKN